MNEQITLVEKDLTQNLEKDEILLVSRVEAVLFALGEPAKIDDIMTAVGADRRKVKNAVKIIEERFSGNEFGIMLLRLGDEIQLATKPEFADNIKIALNTKRQSALTPAAAEVLAIIAYNQPVTKGFVERIREVNSDSVVNTLVERELIEEAGRVDLPGRAMTYRTTANFLRCFGFTSLDDLPEPPKKIPEEYLTGI